MKRQAALTGQGAQAGQLISGADGLLGELATCESAKAGQPVGHTGLAGSKSDFGRVTIFFLRLSFSLTHLKGNRREAM